MEGGRVDRWMVNCIPSWPMVVRILQDHTEGSSLQSQALQTLQERLREAEGALQREQDSYRQMQASQLTLAPCYTFITHLGVMCNIYIYFKCKNGQTNTFCFSSE